jgi:WD40 repeat protein
MASGCSHSDRGDTRPEAWGGLHRVDGHVLSSWQAPDLTPDWFRFDNSAGMSLDANSRILRFDVVNKYLIATIASGQVLLFNVDPSGKPAKPGSQNAMPLAKVQLPNEPYAVALAPDESIAVVGASDGTLRVLRVPDLREIGLFRRHQAHIKWARFSPDGSLLATNSNDHSVRLWQREGERLEELIALPHRGRVGSVSIGHKNRLLCVLVAG